MYKVYLYTITIGIDCPGYGYVSMFAIDHYLCTMVLAWHISLMICIYVDAM